MFVMDVSAAQNIFFEWDNSGIRTVCPIFDFSVEADTSKEGMFKFNFVESL